MKRKGQIAYAAIGILIVMVIGYFIISARDKNAETTLSAESLRGITETLTKGNSQANISITVASCGGRQYTPYCFGDACHLPLKIKYQGSLAPSSITFNSSIISHYLKAGDVNLKGLRFEYLLEKQVNVTDRSETCYPYKIGENETNENCTVSYSSHMETKVDWLPLKNAVLNKGVEYCIDVIPSMPIQTGKFGVDVVPQFKIGNQQFNFTELAWFNTTCMNKRSFNLTGGDEAFTYMPLYVLVPMMNNLSYTSVYFVNQSDSGVLNHDLDTYNASDGRYWVNFSNHLTGVNTYYLYYNCTTIANTEDPVNVWDLAALHLNDSTITAKETIVDDAGYSNYSIGAANCVATAAGEPIFGNGKNFTGNTQSVINTTKSYVDYVGSKGKITVALWASINPATDNRIIWDDRTGGGAGTVLADYYGRGQQFGVGSTFTSDPTELINVTKGKEMLILITYENVSGYWQGYQNETIKFNKSIAGDTTDRAGLMFMGKSYTGGDNTLGMIDEVHIWSWDVNPAWVKRYAENQNIWQAVWNGIEYNESGGGGGDTTKPQVFLLWPAKGANFSTTNINLNASFFDDTNVTNASLYVWDASGNKLSYDSANCFQENASLATSCGGLGNGTYTADFSITSRDNNWGTKANVVVDIYVNYSLPIGYTNQSLWQVKDADESGVGVAQVNLTLNESCWYRQKLELRLDTNGAVPSSVNFDCYNGTGWMTMRNRGSGTAYWALYEEAMVWDISTTTVKGIRNWSQNYSIAIPYEGTFYWNYYASDNASTINSAWNNTNYSFTFKTLPVYSGISTIANPSTYSTATFYQFNISWDDYTGIDTVILTFNGTNYTAKNYAGYVYNVTLSNLSAGNYSYSWWANDTSNNGNVTGEYSFNVTKATPTITYLLNGASANISITYPQQINASGSANYGNLSIYLNGTLIEIGKNYSKEAGYWLIDYNVTATVNNTEANKKLYANISKAASTLTLTIVPGLTVLNGTETNVTGDGCPIAGMCNLSINGTVLDGNTHNETLGPGVYIYVYNLSEQANYSYATVTKTLEVTANIPVPVINISYPSGSMIYASGANISLNVSVVDGNYCWYEYYKLTKPAVYPSNDIEDVSKANDSIWTTYAYSNIIGSFLIFNYSAYQNGNSTWIYKAKPSGLGSGNAYYNVSCYNSTGSLDWIYEARDPTTVNIMIPEKCYEGNSLSLHVNWTEAVDADGKWYEAHLKSFNLTQNQSFTCNTNSSFLPFSPVSISDTENTLVVFAMTTNGTLVNSSTSWTYMFIENNASYNATTYETMREGFYLNLSYERLGSEITAKLYYNNTEYEATKGSYTTGVNGVSIPFRSDVYAPFVSKPTNISFYWAIALVNSSGTFHYNTSERLQLVNPIVFSLCNSSNKVPYLNYTFVNETLALENVTATIASSWVYYTTAATYNKTYSYSNAVETASYAFCFSPAHLTIYIKPTIQYDNAECEARNSNPATLTQTNTTLNTTLYLLPLTGSYLYITFYVINTAEQPLSGVLVNISRASVGLIEAKSTGSFGTAAFFVNPTLEYIVSAYKDGYSIVTVTDTFTTSTPYTIILGSSANTSYVDYTQGIKYSVLPSQNTLNNNTNYTFNVTLSSSYWDLQEYGFTIKNISGYALGNVSDTTGTGGIVKLNVNTGNYTQLILYGWWKINGTYSYFNKNYYVMDTSGTGWSILAFFDDLSTYIASGFFGIDDFGLMIFSFLLIFVSTGILSYKFGITSPATLMGFVFTLTLFLNSVGLVPRIGGADPAFTIVFLALITLGLIIREVHR